MNNPKSIITENRIAWYCDEINDIISINNDHFNFIEIKKALLESKPSKFIFDLYNNKLNCDEFIIDNNKIIINSDGITINDNKIDSVIIDEIQKLKKDGYDVENMIKFLINLENNPSENSKENLYTFIKHHGLVITDDGHFIAYKGVREDMYDHYTGNTHLHEVGKFISMDRDEVEDNPDKYCGCGLHCGTYNYALGYKPVIITMKINPKDVVSVPRDCDCQKIRTCKYQVLDITKLEIKAKCVKKDGTKKEKDFDTNVKNSNKKWTNWEIDYVLKNIDSHKIEDIAKNIGRSVGSVKRKVFRIKYNK